MGAIGGLLGTAGGQAGTGFQTPSGTNQAELAQAQSGDQNSMAGQQALLTALQGQNGLANQNQVYNQTMGVANGSGPNPAQAMLNQSTGANVANQAALQAGQRGAAGNVGLMARQAGMQGANIQQNSAGQAATMQANQSLNALNSAGSMANTMAANQIGQTNANTTSQQNNQSILQGANSANNQVQGSLAGTAMQGQQGLIGGILNGAGAAAGMASGGMVQNFDQGGQAAPTTGPQSAFGQNLFRTQAQAQTQNQNFQMAQGAGAQALQQGMGNLGKGIGKAMKGNPSEGQTLQGSPLNQPIAPAENQAALAQGGQVAAMVSPGELRIPKDKVPEVAKGNVSPMEVGQKFPGTPKVKGNSYSNDVIKTKLPVGDFIIPNSVMQSSDPENNAAKFVRAYLAKKGKSA